MTKSRILSFVFLEARHLRRDAPDISGVTQLTSQVWRSDTRSPQGQVKNSNEANISEVFEVFSRFDPKHLFSFLRVTTYSCCFCLTEIP